MKYIECMECAGKGYVQANDFTKIECPDCQGQGEIVKDDSEDTESIIDDMRLNQE